MQAPSFIVLQIDTIEDVPAWWTGPERDEVVADIEENPTPYDREYSYLLVKRGDEVDVFTDGGEPEDRYFNRDWSWVADAIKSAYWQGRKDEERSLSNAAARDRVIG